MNTTEQVESVVVPPQSGGALRARAGDTITVTDPQGAQIGDTWAISLDDPSEWLSTGCSHIILTELFPAIGQSFYTNRYRKILTLVADRSPGIHDTLCSPCDPYLYAHLGLGSEHPSCYTNFERAVTDAGLKVPLVPEPVNLFQNTPISGNTINFQRAASRPGDSIVFQAEMDLLFVVASCSYDLPPLNGERCSELVVERCHV